MIIKIRTRQCGILQWDTSSERWLESAHLFGKSRPNIEEWADFWCQPVSADSLLESDDVAFDGRPFRNVSWPYRAQRWLELRGTAPPTVAQLPSGYSVIFHADGWMLHDDILERDVFGVDLADHVAWSPLERIDTGRAERAAP